MPTYHVPCPCCGSSSSSSQSSSSSSLSSSGSSLSSSGSSLSSSGVLICGCPLPNTLFATITSSCSFGNDISGTYTLTYGFFSTIGNGTIDCWFYESSVVCSREILGVITPFTFDFQVYVYCSDGSLIIIIWVSNPDAPPPNACGVGCGSYAYTNCDEPFFYHTDVCPGCGIGHCLDCCSCGNISFTLTE